MDEELDPHSWEIRETFAYYGRAVYAFSVVEVALAHVLLYAQFMRKVRDDYIATKGKGFDRKKYEHDFDAFMEDQFAQTMGNLMRRVEKFSAFDDVLKARIADAKKRRDFLTHHFWRERSIDFATSAGRERMREELNTDADMFEKLDRDIDAASAPLRATLGDQRRDAGGLQPQVHGTGDGGQARRGLLSYEVLWTRAIGERGSTPATG